jgi:hypothetical protein
VQRVRRLPDLVTQRVESVDIIVGTLDVVQPVGQRGRCGGISEACRGEAGPRPVAQAVEIARPGDTDDRDIEAAVTDQAGESGKDLLVRQVTGSAEEDEDVGPWGGL